MADGNLTAGGLTIPGSASRRKKAYSVSLHENNFDISEVPCSQEEILSLDGDRNLTQHDHSLTPVADKCHSCGQNLPQINDLRRTPVSNNSPNSHCNKNTPVDRQASSPWLV